MYRNSIWITGLMFYFIFVFHWSRQKQLELEHHKKTDETISACPSASHLFAKRPELAYHLIQVVFFGAMAVTTLRMKYLWTPYMCVLAGVSVGDFAIWQWVLEKWRTNSRLVVSTCTSISNFHSPLIHNIDVGMIDSRHIFEELFPVIIGTAITF